MPKANDTCIVCNAGKYRALQTDLEVETQDGTKVVVKDVPVFRCEACGDELIPASSHAYVDRIIAEQTEQLSKRDVKQLFDGFERTQAEVTADLGLGPKTLTRWLSGSQHPNRALGFYLRAVAEFPQVYAWIKNRTWKAQDTELSMNRDQRVPQRIFRYRDLEEAQQPVPTEIQANHASAFRRSVFSLRPAA